jgi:hypothetical protein
MSLIDEVRGLVRSAHRELGAGPDGETLDQISERLDEPLRVAIAGKVKAGKSTLLNALVGQELAPTDAGESTRIVTWYRDGLTYRATLYPRGGEPIDAPFARDGGPVRVDLGVNRAEDVERLVIDWPSGHLQEITLIDTPGIASLSTEVSKRTHAFLTAADEPTAADAVLYLMRHLHATDVRFLESFHDREVASATPINAIGVLSRADEIGVGRPDAMATAERIADRYRREPAVRRLCQTVVPVAGLLAETGATLREEEFRAVTRIASLPDPDREPLLLSVDRFRDREASGLPSRAEREGLLLRFGLFGLRLSIQLVREGAISDSSGLAAALLARSGLEPLRQILLSQFADRADALKARSAILAIQSILAGRAGESSELTAQVERILSGAHELAEIRLLAVLRAGAVPFRPEEAEDAERLLGIAGTSPAARLGLPAEADAGTIATAARTTLARWQDRAINPMSTRVITEAARILARTCEGILAWATAG